MTVAIPEPTPPPLSLPPVGEGLTAEQATDLKSRFDRGEQCKHCGGIHNRACPRVRRLAFHNGNTIAEVEFWPEGRWSDEHIIWPEDVDAALSDAQ